MKQLKGLYNDSSKFPSVKDERLPITYRLSEIDGETIESVKIGKITLNVSKDDKNYKIISVVEGLSFHTSFEEPVLLIDEYSAKDRDALLEDIKRLTKDETFCVPDEVFGDDLFESNRAYADVCKRIGDYVISNIQRGEFRSHPYLITQYNHLREDESFSGFPEVKPIFKTDDDAEQNDD